MSLKEEQNQDLITLMKKTSWWDAVPSTKKIEYQCCLIGVLPFFYISDCIRCGICRFS